MKRPKFPSIQIDVDGERYVVGDLMASEYEWMASVTNDTVCNREDLVQGIETKDARTWRALLRVMRKRNGLIQNYEDIDLSIDAADYDFIDADGKPIEPAVERKSCGKHEFTMTCDDCELLPIVDDVVPRWVYVDHPERQWFPTKGTAQPSPAPVPLPSSSGNSSASAPGVTATA